MGASEARLFFWLPIAACWGLAVAALYLHPVIWVLFAVALIYAIVRGVRSWRAEDREE